MPLRISSTLPAGPGCVATWAFSAPRTVPARLRPFLGGGDTRLPDGYDDGGALATGGNDSADGSGGIEALGGSVVGGKTAAVVCAIAWTAACSAAAVNRPRTRLAATQGPSCPFRTECSGKSLHWLASSFSCRDDQGPYSLPEILQYQVIAILPLDTKSVRHFSPGLLVLGRPFGLGPEMLVRRVNRKRGVGL